jgi:ACS family allantoate permease-like MFS transporter
MSPSWEMTSWERKEASTTVDDTVSPVQGGRANSTPTTFKDTTNNDDYDDAADIFADTADMFQYTDKEADWVRWKVDLILLPMVCQLSGVL